ncbi:unnamed protein product [Brassicogethes aeneus]|uniref:Germinal-center associated nuclear protein n=1 Tax=Brassicogethes aeneus TaxID=1431903 RepID=A0A9P0BKA7_BRAAE|nr:unnamed protein product [Brassicogethes aeneus]
MEGGTGPFRIICSNYPEEFMENKKLAKQYFMQYGEIKKLIFRKVSKVIIVEYEKYFNMLNALSNAGEYNGKKFKVSVEKKVSPTKKKRVHKEVDPDWVDDPAVREELEAMGGLSTIKDYNLRPKGMDVDSPRVEDKNKLMPKLKRSWKVAENVPGKILAPKKKVVAKKPSFSNEQLDLINIVKQQNTTVEEKYRCLDARDKLVRILLKKKVSKTSSATVGTCPDMCPEKERLMRETQHQVALYEQEENGRGMNPNLAVKQYSRSSADQETPLPYELRPVAVLQMTMGYLLHKIVDMCDTSDVNVGEWFHFLWDRTRGIRKDITQQELCCHGSVELVEQCARFHIHCSARLVGEEPSVFDQKINTENLTKCLQTLKYMYHDLQLKGVNCSDEAEFRAYIILLNLNDGNFMWEVQQLKADIQKSPEIKFALEVHSALDKNNFVKFFKLLYSTTYLNACVLMRYFVQVRVKAIQTLLRCYSRRNFSTAYPLRDLVRMLAFDDAESALDFFGTYGLVAENQLDLSLNQSHFQTPELPYILDRSTIVESKRNTSVGEVICGKPLPGKLFEHHQPSNSFDGRGYLTFNEYLSESDLKVTNEEAVFQRKTESPKPPKATTANIFAPKPDTVNIFATKPDDVSIFAKSIFPPPIPEEKPAFFKQPQIFGDTKSIFGGSAPPIFGKIPAMPKAAGIFGGDRLTNPEQKKGGFSFDITKPPPNIFATPKALPQIRMPLSPDEDAEKMKQLEQQRLLKETLEREEELIREKIRKEEEQIRKLEEKRRTEEEMRVKQLEMEKLKKQEEERKLEEMRRREEHEKRKKEALDRKQEEERRLKRIKEETIKKKNAEIQKTVQDVVNFLVSSTEETHKSATLKQIKSKIQNRLVLKMFGQWRNTIVKNKRKRKAVDYSPIWVNTKSIPEEAKELHTSTQDLTLKYMKRYKKGVPYDINALAEKQIEKINLVTLTYGSLSKRFHELGLGLQKNIFWKVSISLPSKDELETGLTRIEETLDKFLQWKDKSGTKILIEQSKAYRQSVTYCLERQQGFNTAKNNSNGIIFVADDFNPHLQQRLVELLKGYGVFTKIPIVILLQNYDEKSNDKLKALTAEKIVSDYNILVDNFTPQNLMGLLEEGLIFLASKQEKPPPLEMTTFKSFMTKHLCTEVWRKANSFAKWNSNYESCLKNPKTVISLYNEGLSRLKQIILNKSCLEFATFPDEFVEYLDDKHPDYLPCGYRYIPKFCRDKKYLNKLSNILDDLKLPKFLYSWPPKDEAKLELAMMEYCENLFTNDPTKAFYKIMGVLLQDIDPVEDFHRIGNTMWTNVIELISLELLDQTDLSLQHTEYKDKSIFDEYMVVYDVNTLNDYTNNDWYYINNLEIRGEITRQLNKQKNEVAPKRKRSLDLNLSGNLDETLKETDVKFCCDKNVSKMKQDLEEFNAMMKDLEDSINTHKRISSTFESTLKNIIDDK